MNETGTEAHRNWEADMIEKENDEEGKFPVALILVGILLWSMINLCTPPQPEKGAHATLPANASPSPDSTKFRIVAESPVRMLQDGGILDAFSKETGIQLAITYLGPVDIRNAVSRLSKDKPVPVDAYWPGSSLWLPGSVTVEPAKPMKTYVVLAVDPDAARTLGWEAATGITASDVVNAIQAGKINLAMSSATQSTPGAVFYLAMYTALSGKPVLTSDELNNAGTVEKIQAMLKGIDRSAVDLVRLEEVFIDDKTSGAHLTNAIVIYESLAIDLNRKLIAAGQEPMTIFYVDGATAIADVPLRYVDNGDPNKLAQFQKLASFLRRPDIQERIQALGWRTDPIGMKCTDCDPAVFNPGWGIDIVTEFPEMRFPKPAVARAALDWYQIEFRKPSFTVYCLDYSGSMDTGGRAQMVDAMDLLLDQTRASEVSLQATPGDVSLVYGFSTQVEQIGAQVQGDDSEASKELSGQIAAFRMGQGTALFDCVQSAIVRIGAAPAPGYCYSVIALTDGGSNEGATLSDFAAFYKKGTYSIPVYGIQFGSADFSQLNQFKMTGGDVYDGRKDVATAFRMAKGNCS